MPSDPSLFGYGPSPFQRSVLEQLCRAYLQTLAQEGLGYLLMNADRQEDTCLFLPLPLVRERKRNARPREIIILKNHEITCLNSPAFMSFGEVGVSQQLKISTQREGGERIY